jgi:predicted PurR-regulated permease PerM
MISPLKVPTPEAAETFHPGAHFLGIEVASAADGMDVLQRPSAPPVASVPAPTARVGSSPVSRFPLPSSWRTADVLRAAAVVFGLYLVLRLAWVAHALLLAAFLGVLFGLAVARGTDFLERWRIPRGLGAALIVFSFYGLIALLAVWSAPTLRQQFGELGAQLPQAAQKIDAWFERNQGGFLGLVQKPQAPAAAPQTPSASQGGASGEPGGAPAAPPAESGALRSSLAGQLGALGSYVVSVLTSTIAVLAGLLLITFVTIYVGAEPDLYRSGLLHLVPHRSRERAAEVLRAVGATLRKWLVTQLLAMVAVGAVTTLALWALGVESALSLGIIAGLLEFIPNVGPILSALPAMGMAFLDSPQKAVLVAVVYIVIQQLEGHLLIPLIMKRGLDLPPVLTLLGQAVMAIAFGFLGLLVAVPLTAAILVTVKMLYVEDVVGDDVEVPTGS